MKRNFNTCINIFRVNLSNEFCMAIGNSRVNKMLNTETKFDTFQILGKEEYTNKHFSRKRG